MKIISSVFLVLAIFLIAYGYWGAFTTAGNKVYDEMDAYYPFFMLIGGIVLLLVFFIIILIRRRKAKNKY